MIYFNVKCNCFETLYRHIRFASGLSTLRCDHTVPSNDPFLRCNLQHLQNHANRPAWGNSIIENMPLDIAIQQWLYKASSEVVWPMFCPWGLDSTKEPFLSFLNYSQSSCDSQKVAILEVSNPPQATRANQNTKHLLCSVSVKVFMYTWTINRPVKKKTENCCCKCVFFSK